MANITYILLAGLLWEAYIFSFRPISTPFLPIFTWSVCETYIDGSSTFRNYDLVSAFQSRFTNFCYGSFYRLLYLMIKLTIYLG